MACIACECYAKRITNINRDEELKVKFANLTGCRIVQDCFICDDCNEKLESSYLFKQQCVETYRRLHYEASDPFTEVSTKNRPTEIYIESEAVFEEGEQQLQLTNDEEQEYEDVYLEFDVEEAAEDKDEQGEETLDVDDEKPKPRTQSAPRNVMNRKSYTVAKKLQIIEYAEDYNNRVAGRFFNMNESSVRCFRRQKEMLLKMSPLKKTNRKAFPHWPKLEAELKDFVINHPKEHGTKAKLKDIKEHAIEISKKHGIDNFNGSNSYIFKFMQRHQLPSASPRPRKSRQDLSDSIKQEVA